MSTIKTTTLSTLDGTATVPVNTVVNGSAKAWVNFNGTGTVAIRASFNVTSITDNGTGDYTVNFTVAMVDANYAIAGFSNFAANTAPASALSAGSDFAPSTSSCRVKSSNTTSGGTQDAPYVCVAIFR
jgi:hypothetical protein